jgi:hypothetical protein
MKTLFAFAFSLLLFTSIHAQTRTVTVISEKANLRGTPSASGAVVEQVAKDEVFELIKSNGAWYLVQTPRFVGWINGNTIKLNFDIQASEPAVSKEVPTRVDSESASRPSVIEPTTPASITTTQTVTADNPTDPQRIYITGERGGCYYINSNGNKTYVDRSLCGEPPLQTTPAPSTSGGEVQVRGYYRKDGTYVRPYTRSRPRRKG